MKKAGLLVVCVLVACLLFGCTYYPDPSGTQIYYNTDGTSYAINFNTNVVEYDGTEYPFEVNRDDGKLWITIHYPNGATYYSAGSNTVCSDNYDPYTYTPGETLDDLLRENYTAKKRTPGGFQIFTLIFCLFTGAIGAFFPRIAWEIEHLFKSWQYQNAEPSDAGLMMIRVGSVILMVAGVILFFCNWN